MDTTLAQFQVSAGKVLTILFLSTVVYALAEMIYLQLSKRIRRPTEFRTTLFGMLGGLGLSALITALYGPVNLAIISIWASKFALFQTDLSWYWWVYGLVVYEFFYWVQHWLAHKVRLFWCIHSPHHAPESMNMFVGFNHSFIESLFYMPFFLGLFPALLGVHPIILIGWSVVDVIWGNLLHISDHVVKGRLGILERFLQTPAYHRAHHARNVLYIDINFTSMTLLWDWLLGTLQPLRDDVPAEYGITRELDTANFWDVHFGELRLLWRDMLLAPGLTNKLRYVLMPPGWSHTGTWQTAATLKSGNPPTRDPV